MTSQTPGLSTGMGLSACTKCVLLLILSFLPNIDIARSCKYSVVCYTEICLDGEEALLYNPTNTSLQKTLPISQYIKNMIVK